MPNAAARRLSPLLAAVVAVAFVALTSSACSRATGLEGELVFSYATLVDPANFNKPVAVGASLDIEIVEVGSERDITLLSAESTDPGVLAVTGLGEHEVVVEARAPGAVELLVRARTEDGREVSDRIQLRAAPADRLVVTHMCSYDAEGTYLTSSNAFLYRELRRDSGEPLVGWGHLPAELDPDSGASLIDLEREPSILGVRLPAHRARVTLRSTLDAQRRWTLRVIEPEDIDELEVQYAPSRALEGDTRVAIATPRAESQVVCQHRLTLEATSLTPELCRVTPGPPGSELVEIDALAYGVCRYRVSLGALGRELTLPIGKLPGPDEGDASGDTVTASAEEAIPRWLRQWPAILSLVLLSQVLIGLLAGFVRGQDRPQR